MSAAVMGARSFLKRPWDDIDQGACADVCSSSSAIDSEPRITLSASPPLPVKRDFTLASSTSGRGSSFGHDDTAVRPNTVYKASTSTASSLSYLEDTVKRPRLLHGNAIGTDTSSLQGGQCVQKSPRNFDWQRPEQIEYKDRRASSAFSTGEAEAGELTSVQTCTSCSEAECIAQNIVSGLLELESELRQALAISADRREGSEEPHDGVTKLGLRSSLLWACSTITRTTALLRQGIVTRLPSIVANKVDHSGISSEPLSRQILDIHEREIPDDFAFRYSSTSHCHYPPRLLEITPPATMCSDSSRRGLTSDQSASLPSTQSPQFSASGTAFGSGQSPSQIHGIMRALPSPSAMSHPSLSSSLQPSFSSTFSPIINSSVHNTHLQDLQHQISTKILALQTLQREHDQLLAAFSRSQIRCSTLDKKSQVSDHEINSLTEEKIRLQGQVEALEERVEELAKAKQELQNQGTADSAQWGQIVALSSQLQIQGAEEARRYQADRKAWERDRDGLERRIADLEAGRLALVETAHTNDSVASISGGNILASTSLGVLRTEVLRLQARCRQMEAALRAAKAVTEEMDQVMAGFATIRERIAAETGQGLRDDEGGVDLGSFREQ